MTISFDSFFGIVVVMMLLQPILGPILIYFMLKEPAKPNIEPYELNTFPQDVQDYFIQNIPLLEREGFKVSCCCILSNDTPGMVHCCLLKHSNKQDMATIIVGQSNLRFIEFGSGVKGLDICTNNNLHQISIFPEQSRIKKYNFPNISNINELYTAHLLLIHRHAKDAAPKIVTDGKELDALRMDTIHEMKLNVKDGYFRLDTSSDTYRPTVKGAVFITWKLIWPLKNILRARTTRRMERVLQEVMIDRENVANVSERAKTIEHENKQKPQLSENKESYRIVFAGAIQEGKNLEQVKQRITHLAKTKDAAVVERLFTPPAKNLKHNLSKQEAVSYKKRFEETGACCKILREQSDASFLKGTSPATAQHPLPREKEKAAFKEDESTYPILTEKKRSSGLFVDIADKFRGGPIKNAVGLPHWAVCFIFLPIAVILTMTAILPSVMTGGIFFKNKKLEKSGTLTQAMVIEREILKGDSTVVGKNDLQYYYVSYRFQESMLEQRAQIFSKKEQVSKERYKQLQVDSEVAVFYDQEHPDVSRIKGNYVVFSFPDREALPLFSSQGMRVMFVLIAMTLFGGFAVIGLLIWIIKDIIALFLLRTHGQMSTASVIELEKYEVSKSTEYAMLCRFHASHSSGKSTTITGRQKISKNVYDAYRRKTTADVRYVPKKPECFRFVFKLK